ncbi:N-acetylmuramoyl-L-alanine amidase family protein [Psychrobacillus vulpis]|uniref:N-acetylmuramoyl-L-alanine amidase family protein n=1 Tax=Psychrobacillus vulpis TaxID=2325572 RepID=A0A544TR77_9BACI|nr:N-acetylmuramoyl-L-alanine amidase family protein [Psychrobacillus vulpis]TQR19933.1 N-acetylmuramoyl-L-alanine amidase family protein [Psychrobacillus vulpis]
MSIVIIGVIALAVVGAINYEKIITEIQFRGWKKKIEGIHNYDPDVVRNKLNNIAHQSFSLSGEKLPYGRAKWFVNSDSTFRKAIDANDLEFYGYSPIRSKEELEFKEYGILLAQEGIFASYQIVEQDKKKGKKEKGTITSEFFPFAGLWKVKYIPEQKVIKFYYFRRKIQKLHIDGNEQYALALVLTINSLINTGYTNDIETGIIKEKIQVDFDKYEKNLMTTPGAIPLSIGAMGTVYANVDSHFHEEVLNGIVNNPQGHGFAAEYANDLIDKIKHPFLKVQRVGQGNAKDGADRVVGSTRIQTKYLSSARNSVNAAFKSKVDGGEYKYGGMQLEVPKDQYNEAIELMKGKIGEGKVPEHSNPKDAYKIIRKGQVTWTESKLIAKGGNLTSLKYDALDGVVQSLPVSGISFAIVFAQAKWSGAETKDAAVMAAKAGTKTLVMGTVVYAGSQQITKIMTARIASQTGKKIMAETVAKRSGMVISFGIVMVPNIFNSLTGRISSQQLLKNTLVAGGGFLAAVGASAGAGALLGSVIPGAGNVVGTVVGAFAGVAGGIVGTVGSKKVIDHFIQDDRIEMFAQLKEEYIDIVMSISMTDAEFTEIQEIVFNKSLESKLKDMYKASYDLGSRRYARENIVEDAVEQIIKQRSKIDDSELIEGVEIATKEFFANV